MAVEIGLVGKACLDTQACHSAKAMGSGDLEVFSTPSLVALMEKACWTSIVAQLAEGESSVGVEMKVTHSAATSIGVAVWAESEVTAVDGKRIDFTVTAFDGSGEIGKAYHQRVVIGTEKFMARVQSKSHG